MNIRKLLCAWHLSTCADCGYGVRTGQERWRRGSELDLFLEEEVLWLHLHFREERLLRGRRKWAIESLLGTLCRWGSQKQPRGPGHKQWQWWVEPRESFRRSNPQTFLTHSMCRTIEKWTKDLFWLCQLSEWWCLLGAKYRKTIIFVPRYRA